MTLFMTTHYLEEADNLCDRIAIIDHGRIVALDTPSKLKESLGGDIITLTIEQAEKDLTRLMESTVRVKEVKRQDNIYRLKVENGEETAPKILNQLIQKGHTVTKLSLTKPTLDEVYLEYTGKSMRDAENSEGTFSRRMTMRRARHR